MKLFKNRFKENSSNVAINKIEILNKRLMYGFSTRNDLAMWESNLELIDTSKDQFNQFFFKYLLKHYPNDKRLKAIYHNRENIDEARDVMYREALLQTLGDVLYMLRYKWMDLDIMLIDRRIRKMLITKIEKYVYFKNKNREMLFEKKNDTSDSFSEQDLEDALKEFSEIIPNFTAEQEEWHSRVNHLGTFKYLEYDGVSVFKKRYKLGLQHGILLGDVGSGKTKAIQNEIELILKNTNDDIIVIDNDGLYEEFCHKNNGMYMKMNKDNIIYNNSSPTIGRNNRLKVLDIHNPSDEIKLQHAVMALEYAYQKMNEQSKSSKQTWLYIEEVNELVFDDCFLDMLINNRRKNGVITIATNRVKDIIENDNSMRRLLSNIPYIRLFRQSPTYRENLAKFVSIDPNMLEFDDISTSWAIIESKPFQIFEKIV